MAICKCQNCINETVNGKLVSQSTYRRHNKSNPLQKNQPRFRCVCSLYPSGHFFHSRSAYYSHRKTLNRDKSSEAEYTDDNITYESVSNHNSDTISNSDNDLASDSNSGSISNSDYSGSDQQYIDEILEELSDNSKSTSGLIFIKNIIL
jgi:hypothetical protein